MSKTLSHTLRALAHPSTLFWVLLLLVNDQLLRWHHPSWLTGKLSDVAWLAVAPLVVAVPLALVASRQHEEKQPRSADGVVIAAATAVVGCIFAIVKAIPAVTAAFSLSFRTVFGWTPLIVCDPTDLLTLPALAFAWLRWKRGKSTNTQITSRKSTHDRWANGDWTDAEVDRGRLARMGDGARQSAGDAMGPSSGTGAGTLRRGWGVLALAALATLGNSGPPNEGIICLQIDGDRVIAGPSHQFYNDTFVSDDGGLTWTALADPGVEEQDLVCPGHTGAWTLPGPEADEHLRFVPNEGIERSTDNGATWSTALALTGQDARMAYYATTRSNTWGTAGPHEALIDPVTNHVIVAMGHEGVLVRTSPGDWQWVGLGQYRYEPLETPGQIAILLQGELGLALAAGLATVALAGWRRAHWVLRVLSVLVALGVALVPVIVKPATISGYATVISYGTVIAALVVSLIVAGILAFQQARGMPKRLWGLLGWLVLTVLGFALPFLAWARGRLVTYTPAAWIAITVTVIVWLAATVSSKAPEES